MMPINSLFISLMLFKIYSYDQIQMQANFIKEFALISLLLVNTHKLYINFLNLTAIKITEYLILNNQDSNQVLYSIQFSCSVILIMVIMYAKLYFLRHLYMNSKVGKYWIDIVNQNFNQKVFTSTYNKQTGKLELIDYNQACLKDINKNSTITQSKFQEIFNRYLQNFKFSINDCLVYRPRSDIADKSQAIDLKQYLVNRHIHQLNQLNDRQTSFTKLSEYNSTNKNSLQLKQVQNQDLSFQKNNSSSNNNKSSSSHGKQVEQIQAQFYDMKSNTAKPCRIKIVQNSVVSSFSQLLIIIEDESYLQDLSRYKQEKQTIERFLFSLMQNFQEKLRYIIWGLENSDQQISKIESYILINQVFCIFDYFIIKSKKLKNKFNQQISKKISKILNVESFTWQNLMKELVSLFCDMTIVSDIDFESEEIKLFQDRRKLKQVLIALLSLAQCRAVETYELKISRIKKQEWNAILLMIIFQTNDKPSDYKKKFYEYLNGNSISTLNEIEYEVLKETVMIIGPYQLNEEISENGLVQISFAFFEDLEVIYESISSQARKPENLPRDDAMIRNLMSPKNQELWAATYDQYVNRIKERQRKSEKRIAIMEVSSKSKPNCDEISSSSDEISQEMEIKSIDDKFFCLTSLSENQKKVQAIPDEQSFKQMNKLTKAQSNQQLITAEQQLALNSPTFPTEEYITKQTKPAFQQNQKRSSTLLINAKFSNNYSAINEIKPFLKNSKINSYYNNRNQNKPKTDEDKIDFTLKMQASIYNQHISQYSSKVLYHKNQEQKSPIKQSNFNQQNQIGNSININKESLNLCRQLTQLSDNKIETFSPKMQHFSSYKLQGHRNSQNSGRLSKFKTQEINVNYNLKDTTIDFKKQSINSLLQEFNKNFEQQSHNQDKCDNFSLYLSKN
ncbi:hypothetical protein ABPG72_016564 [Tetrahymena utriculariae]